MCVQVFVCMLSNLVCVCTYKFICACLYVRYCVCVLLSNVSMFVCALNVSVLTMSLICRHTKLCMNVCVYVDMCVCLFMPTDSCDECGHASTLVYKFVYKQREWATPIHLCYITRHNRPILVVEQLLGSVGIPVGSSF